MTSPQPSPLIPQDARIILQPFTKDQLLSILQNVVVRDPLTLSDPSQTLHPQPRPRNHNSRPPFTLLTFWSTYKNTAKSKGYGFVTFKHVDGAVLALKQPSKKIDGRITVTQLAAANRDLNNVGNVPFEVSAERLLSCFLEFGEIEEGPLGFDKQLGKGFAFFVYRTEEGARKAVAEQVKTVDGFQVVCKMASDGKKGKVAAALASGPILGSMNAGYGGMTSFGGYSSGPPLSSHPNPHMNSSVPSGIGSGPDFGNQPPPLYGSGGGYGSSGGYGSGGAAQEHQGMNNFASSMNRLPPSQGGYNDGGKYGPSSAYSAQSNLPPAGLRGPPGGMYQGGPPYY